MNFFLKLNTKEDILKDNKTIDVYVFFFFICLFVCFHIMEVIGVHQLFG